MVNNNEKLIRFPVSEWIMQVNNFENYFSVSDYCICYQYDINNHGYGPYGFKTITSKGLLSFLFNRLIFYNGGDNKLNIRKEINDCGIYFYGDANNKIKDQIEKYNQTVLKNKLRIKRGRFEETYPEKPVLFSLYRNNKIDGNVINKMIDDGYSFLVNFFITPVAGESLILFDNDIWVKAVEYCRNYGVYTQEVDSVDKLKDW